VEVDYDPRVISYLHLLAVFLASHTPTHPAFSSQYRSAVFYRTEDEREAAQEAIARAETTVGRLYVAVERFPTFHWAEDYHQKYTLRRYREVTEEFRRMFPCERDFVDSTAVARVNGWLSGCATAEQLDRELQRTGLSPRVQASVLSGAMPRGRARIACGA
jgi:hypothetical protein